MCDSSYDAALWPQFLLGVYTQVCKDSCSNYIMG
jgi:hypothetical protein